MEKKRSKGVTVFGILLICSPLIISLVAVILLLTFTSIPLKFFLKATIKTWMSNYSILIFLAKIFLGVGVLKLKEWARKLVIVFAGVGLFGLLINCYIKSDIIFTDNLTLVIMLLSFIEVSLFLYFFTRPKVKEQFK